MDKAVHCGDDDWRMTKGLKKKKKVILSGGKECEENVSHFQHQLELYKTFHLDQIDLNLIRFTHLSQRPTIPSFLTSILQAIHAHSVSLGELRWQFSHTACSGSMDATLAFYRRVYHSAQRSQNFAHVRCQLADTHFSLQIEQESKTDFWLEMIFSICICTEALVRWWLFISFAHNPLP